uniref:Uncharacterized protein n=1 Tax=Parascaris univalens TaxID=6257 RepID=A0A915BSF4_PARUN
VMPSNRFSNMAFLDVEYDIGVVAKVNGDVPKRSVEVKK